MVLELEQQKRSWFLQSRWIQPHEENDTSIGVSSKWVVWSFGLGFTTASRFDEPVELRNRRLPRSTFCTKAILGYWPRPTASRLPATVCRVLRISSTVPNLVSFHADTCDEVIVLISPCYEKLLKFVKCKYMYTLFSTQVHLNLDKSKTNFMRRRKYYCVLSIKTNA
jgi:hypothetical protein